MFLSGPWFGVWILHGNYSSSLLFDTVPLTDPLMTLQSLASGHLPGHGSTDWCGNYHRALRPGRKAIILQLGLPAEPDYRLSELVTRGALTSISLRRSLATFATCCWWSFWWDRP